MSSESQRSVENRPSKPLLVFDGDCHFCRRWIERWRCLTADAIDYAPFQELTERFPEIPREAFENSVQFIETDGRVFSGAEAVFRSLGYKRGCRWMIWAHRHVPGFAAATEGAYRQVARNRRSASFFTRLLWGNDVRPPTYVHSRRLFLRSLGGIYLVAFLSLWTQVDGLIGSRGILPIGEFLQTVHDRVGNGAMFYLPTLSWLNSSDAFLHFLCGAGAAISVLLIIGILPAISLTLLFVLYLSLTVAGQTFLSFQWDILLLETGFLAIFFAPTSWRLGGGQEGAVPRIGHFLLKLLLFKLMLMSGVVKLTSGDESWWDLTALNYHYETQPLPTVIGWWAHQSPEWFRKLSTFFVLFVETVVPFFIWAPRRLRHLSCGLFILLQVLIGLTGNYCFFNLLTIVLCLPLLDDTYWATRRWPKVFRRNSGETSIATVPTASSSSFFGYVRRSLAIGALIVFVPINAQLIYSAFKPREILSSTIEAVSEWVEPFRIVNGYGLFRVMTKSRPEIIFEGSADGVEWLPYEFEWKPGVLNQAPRWVAPHQPRLDWQMWFAALGTYRNSPWFVSLTKQLLVNNPEVTRLLARNPFPDKPPLLVRSTLFEYHFTTTTERRASGAWWKREERREYLPALSLKDFGN